MSMPPIIDRAQFLRLFAEGHGSKSIADKLGAKAASVRWVAQSLGLSFTVPNRTRARLTEQFIATYQLMCDASNCSAAHDATVIGDEHRACGECKRLQNTEDAATEAWIDAARALAEQFTGRRG